MAHDLKKNAPLIIKAALGLLEEELTLGQLVYRDFDSDFAGKQGDTVNVKRPARLTAEDIGFRSSNRQVTGQDLVESTFPVKLREYPVNAVDLSDEEMTLDVENFGSQVLQPQVEAIARYIEARLAFEMQANTVTGALGAKTDGSDLLAKITRARKLLNDRNVSRGGRILLVGSAVEEALLNLAILTEADKSGTTEALREAILGRLRGFTVVGSNQIDEDVAIAYHPTAFALITRAPVIPDGASFGAATSYGGYAMRWIKDYDASRLSDRSVLGTFMGIEPIKDPVDLADIDGAQSMQRAVRIDLDVAP
ncbi:P22 phage major capsid protein family protein [Dactylosporangium sp. CA-139066]|uniref:P22 phage major capsid protein family protein n=1 Tax=Dactylosporangium sp. CA-139066 TaxID=3239930 RepID=UPI003D8FD910